MNEAQEIDVLADVFAGMFDNEYTKEEIDWYGLSSHDGEHVEIVSRELIGRVDQYLHKSFEVGEVTVPIMHIDGELWMSLTPMEIQSAAYALAQASGEVATAGLGMGYFALKAAEMEHVDKVDVYEINEHVIEFFNTNFSHRKGFEKINIIHGNVRGTMKDKYYDLVFVDIYQTMLPEEIGEDLKLLTSNNDIGVYLFWGYELVLWAASQHDVALPWRNPLLAAYFKEFFADESRLGLAKTEWALPDEEYVENIIETLHNEYSMLP